MIERKCQPGFRRKFGWVGLDIEPLRRTTRCIIQARFGPSFNMGWKNLVNANGFITGGDNGGRTVGDFLVNMEYINGGTSALVGFFIWEHTGSNNKADGYDWVEMNHNEKEDEFSQPTQSLLQRWLREEFDIHIIIDVNSLDGYGGDEWDAQIVYDDHKGEEFIDVQGCSSYEKALEAGLIKALNP